MQWSKIRTQLRSLVTPSLAKRVDFHLTNYRHHSDHAHEVWITVDKERVFTASYCAHMIEECVMSGRTGLPYWGVGKSEKELDDLLIAREVHAATDVVGTLRTYLDLDPKVALTSTDPLLKALAIVDRRVGSRTIRELKVSDDEHSLVKTFFALRKGSSPPQKTRVHGTNDRKVS